jgi:hypothetical protein
MWKVSPARTTVGIRKISDKLVTPKPDYERSKSDSYSPKSRTLTGTVKTLPGISL